MKKLYLLALLFISIVSYGQNKNLKIDDDLKAELKPIFDSNLRKYLSSNRSTVEFNDLKLSKIDRTKAGYIAIYDQYFQGYQVENGGAIVVLKNDKGLNRIKSKLKPIPINLFVPEIDMKVDFKKLTISIFNDIESFVSIVPMLVMNDGEYTPITRVFFVSKEYPQGTYYNFEMKNRMAYNSIIDHDDKDVAEANNVSAFCTTSSCNPSANCTNAGVGFIYPNYPSNPLILADVIDAEVEGTNLSNTSSDVCLACCSNIRYFNNVDPPLSSATGYFDYTSSIPEVYGKNYATVFSYMTIRKYRDNFVDQNVVINYDVDGQNTPAGTYNGSNLVFGFDPNAGWGPCAADIFWVIQAMQEMHYNLYGINEQNGLYAGLKDFMTQNFLWGEGKNLNDNVCNHFGGDVEFSTNYALTCFTNDKVENRQIFSTFLVGLSGSNGIGSRETVFNIVDHFLKTGISHVNMVVSDADAYNLLLSELYESAVAIHDNDPNIISSATLCEIKEYINSYFYNCKADYYIKDDLNDTGIEPNNITTMWTSPDIWNSLSQNGPSSKPLPGVTNYIHVRVNNKNGIYDDTKKLHVYFSMASLGLTWPDDWMSQTINGQQVSGEILPAQNLSASSPEVLIFAWTPPDPALIGITDKHHVCIYARITDAENKVRNVLCTEEGPSVYENTVNYNSIAWKNLTILGDDNSAEVDATASVYLKNTNNDASGTIPEVSPNSDIFQLTLIINPEPTIPGVIPVGLPDPNFFSKGNLFIEPLGSLNQAIALQANQSSGYQLTQSGTYQIINDKFRLRNFILPRGQKYLLRTRFVKNRNFRPVSFELVLRNSANEIVGGESYQIFANGNTIITPRNSHDLIEPKLLLAPNPASNELVLRLMNNKQEFLSFNLYDIEGKLIKHFERTLIDREFKIDITSLKEGQYFISSKFDDGTEVSLQFIKE